MAVPNPSSLTQESPLLLRDHHFIMAISTADVASKRPSDALDVEDSTNHGNSTSASLYERKAMLIDGELDAMGMGRYQWYIWSLCGLGYFLDLLWAQAFGLIATPLQHELGFSSRYAPVWLPFADGYSWGTGKHLHSIQCWTVCRCICVGSAGGHYRCAYDHDLYMTDCCRASMGFQWYRSRHQHLRTMPGRSKHIQRDPRPGSIHGLRNWRQHSH